MERVWAKRREITSTTVERREQQESLFNLYCHNRSVAIRNKIAILNDGLALEVAHRWKQLCDVPLEDLSQIARVGLIAAIEAFDPALGNAFSSFAMPRIQGEVQHFLRDHNWDMVGVSRRSIEVSSKVKRIKRRWISQGRMDIDEGKIATSVGISKRRWQQVCEETVRHPVLEIDEAHWVCEAEQDENEAILGELRKEVAKLPNPYRRCIMERYFSELSEEAIAKGQSAKVAQVRLWLAEGLRRLRTGHLGERTNVSS